MKCLKRSFAVLMILVIFAITLAGCSSSGDTQKSGSNTDERTITDMTGAEVKLPKEVKSVINLWPSSNQMMITLGAQEKQPAYMKILQKPSFTWMQIVNPAITEKPTVGGNGDVTAEELLALKPDFVITANEKDAEAFRTAGLNAACMMFNNYDGLKESMLKTGEALGSDEKARAEKYITFLDKNIQLVQDRLKDVKEEDKPMVHYVDGQSGTTPYKAGGTGTMQEEWIKMAGGKLSTDGILEGMSKEITAEQFLSIDPDVIIVGGLGQAEALKALMSDP
ncbi:MAG: ABC transporter substrate-binding protein, partial [Eubacterium sp.]